MHNKIKYLNKLLHSKMNPNARGGWHAPKAWEGGNVTTTDIFNEHTLSYKTCYQKTEKEFPIHKNKNWIPPSKNYTLQVIMRFFVTNHM